MDYFLVSPAAYDREGAFAQLTERIVDADGTRLQNAEIPVGIHEIRKGVAVRDVGDAYLQVRLNQRIGDLLWFRVHANLVASIDALEAFVAERVVIDESIYPWPLHVQNKAGGEHLRDYVVLWAMRRWDVLDRERSVIDYYKGTMVIKEVRRWALDTTRLPQSDLFLTEPMHWLASERLVAASRQHRLSGFHFEPLA